MKVLFKTGGLEEYFVARGCQGQDRVTTQRGQGRDQGRQIRPRGWPRDLQHCNPHLRHTLYHNLHFADFLLKRG